MRKNMVTTPPTNRIYPKGTSLKLLKRYNESPYEKETMFHRCQTLFEKTWSTIRKSVSTQVVEMTDTLNTVFHIKGRDPTYAIEVLGISTNIKMLIFCLFRDT